jgi:hypothetical protein
MHRNENCFQLKQDIIQIVWCTNTWISQLVDVWKVLQNR